MHFNIEFNGLKLLERRMGASGASWTSCGQGLAPRSIVEQLRAGIEIHISEVTEETNGLLSYNGAHVLLYIMDQNKDKEQLLNNPEECGRYHLAECSTLKGMRCKRGLIVMWLQTIRAVCLMWRLAVGFRLRKRWLRLS